MEPDRREHTLGEGNCGASCHSALSGRRAVAEAAIAVRRTDGRRIRQMSAVLDATAELAHPDAPPR